MSDLSMQKQLAPVPQEPSPAAGPAAPPASDGEGAPRAVDVPPYPWPTPPLLGAGRTVPLSSAEPCEIEVHSGHVSAGILLLFDDQAALALVRIAGSRRTLPLKFSQFRRLTLLRPLQLRGAAAARMATEEPVLLRLDYGDGGVLELPSQGRVERAAGLFSFEPLTEPGALQRSFFPRDRLKGHGTVAGAPAVPLDRTTTRLPVRAAASREAGREAARESAGEATRALPGALRVPSPTPSPAPAPTPAPSAGPAPQAPTPAAAAATPPRAAARAEAEIAPGERTTAELPRPVPPVTTVAQLAEALEAQARMPMVRIGEALMGMGYLSEQALGDALQAQSRDRNTPLGELLVRRGAVKREQLQAALARKMGYPVVDVNAFPVEHDAALKLPVALARRLGALPLMLRAGQLVVALEDPSARSAIEEIEFSAQCKVVPVLACTGTLPHAIEQMYQRLGKDSIEPSADLVRALAGSEAERTDSADKLLASLEQQSDSQRDEDPQIAQSDNSLVRLINTMILEARAQGVSDIHIECPPGRDKVRVRFRRDGVLKPYMELPHTYRNAVVARIKVMCDLDISERRKPQDGKISFGRWVQGQKLELRVATIPTANGLEDVVMRLLASARAIPLDGMNLAPDTLARLRAAVERPYGMVLCVGPTGSGKTTTLHAALNHINTPDRKIWTAEDPVEITQPGLRQVQVNPKIDWTFAKALRAFLRADPDVVMVGEIRDPETAQMAVEASLTGHLVLSTLHTNSAPETVTRLLDMGMDPFSFADSLLAVLAQRLVRRWCRHCVQATPAEPAELLALAEEYRQCFPLSAQAPAAPALVAQWQQQFGREGRLWQHHAPGCSHCAQTGYSGRLGLHELLVVSRPMRHLIQTKTPADQLQQLAMQEGMRTLRQDGILKVLAGLTSIEEVRATSNV